MKKYLQTLALLLCSLTASAYNFEVDGFCYNTISYTEVEVTYRGNSCTEYHNEYTGTVTIPATVTYNNNTYRVTSIGDEAFYGCWGLTTITIPKRVTSIGSSAFYGCSNLTTITIRENSKLTSIGEYAFLGCSNLTDITLPESVTSIGKSAFFNCSSLASITIPENSQLTSIGDYAFKGCSSLTAITIPEGVTSIEYDAFYGCSSLTAVHISSIEAWCNIDFGDSYANPLSYAKNLYIDGELVTELAIPISVTAIKDDAFSGCSSLTAITIPEGVTSIGDWAFHSCI